MRQLHDKHLADLRRSGIRESSFEACGLYSADAEAVRAISGMNVGPGLVFPYPETEGETGRRLERIKLDHPSVGADGKTMKYASPRRECYPEANRLYICALLDREILSDPTVELFITEGEKKAIKACQDGFPTIGLSGVWNWKAKDESGRSRPIEDLGIVDFRDRSVGIVFDSDAASNEQVRRAERALMEELACRGARPFIVRLPAPGRNERAAFGAKFGLDDLLVARGPKELRYLVEWSRNPLPLGCRSVTVLEYQPLRERPWLIDGIWKVGDCGFFAGAPKTKKSLLSLDLAIAVATGQSFLGRETTKGYVIIADEETNYQEFRVRLEQLAAGRGLALSDLDRISFLEKGKLRLDTPASVQDLHALCALTEPTLLVIDPFVRMHEMDENSSQDVAPMLGRLRQVSNAYGLSIVVVHHAKKNSTGSIADFMRGSGDMYGWLDAAILFAADDDQVQLRFAYRYGAAAADIVIRLDSQPGQLRWDLNREVDPEESVDAALRDERRLLVALAEGPMKKTEVREFLKRSGAYSSALIDSLVDRQLVLVEKAESTGGRPAEMVALTDLGRDFLSDDLSSPKGEQEVLKSESEDFVPGGPCSRGVAFSDSASALAGSRYVKKAPNGVVEGLGAGAGPGTGEVNGDDGRASEEEAQ
ncbi:MAG: AAA family ATPase [Planctomycetes bacterium]|nr:AAA family ATPase [Planctomycetota bacterium]